MLARQRQERILEEVQRHGGARVSDLVTTLGVSDMTIRRDIQELARQELVLRVHGGATSISGRSAEEPGFVVKSALHPVPKSAIAVAAAELVEPGASIALSAGTTTYGLAQQLLTVPGLTIVTNSPPAANLLHEAGRDDLTVILTGGVRTPSNALVGPIALGALRTLHVDLLFLGVHGMDERAGFDDPQPGGGRDRPGHGGGRASAGRRRRPQQVGGGRAVHHRGPRAGRRPGDRRRDRRAGGTGSLATGWATWSWRRPTISRPLSEPSGPPDQGGSRGRPRDHLLRRHRALPLRRGHSRPDRQARPR